MGKMLGVAIIGAGGVAAEYVKAFRDHPRTTVVGVLSRSTGRAASLLAAHGVEGEAYRSADHVFADARVEIIVSCTPPRARPEHVVRAAETGRHVVIEKPVALSQEEVRRMRAAVAKAEVKTVTSFVLRWSRQFDTIRQLTSDGMLGELVYAEVDYWNPFSLEGQSDWRLTRSEGGSAILSLGCHAVDALRYLGGEITEVSAYSCAPKKHHEYEYHPVVVATLRFESGAVGKLSTVLEGHAPFTFNVRLVGTVGTIDNDRLFSNKQDPNGRHHGSIPGMTALSDDVAELPFKQEMDHFLECIETDTESHASIHDACRSMAVCFAIDASAAGLGVPVKVDYRT